MQFPNLPKDTKQRIHSKKKISRFGDVFPHRLVNKFSPN